MFTKEEVTAAAAAHKAIYDAVLPHLQADLGPENGRRAATEAASHIVAAKVNAAHITINNGVPE